MDPKSLAATSGAINVVFGPGEAILLPSGYIFAEACLGNSFEAASWLSLGAADIDMLDASINVTKKMDTPPAILEAMTVASELVDLLRKRADQFQVRPL